MPEICSPHIVCKECLAHVTSLQWNSKCSICTRLSECRQYCHLGRPEKSVTVEHVLVPRTLFLAGKQGLSMMCSYFTCLYKEAIEIYKHPNFNRCDKGLSLKISWFLVLDVGNASRPARRGGIVIGWNLGQS